MTTHPWSEVAQAFRDAARAFDDFVKEWEDARR